MKIVKLGVRSASPAFFDMAARFKPPTASHWYGSGFRIGDRAAAYVYLKYWRQHNPGRKLIVLEDNTLPGTEYSRWLTSAWLFHDIADEVWEIAGAKDIVNRPPGEALYVRTLWQFWKTFMHSARVLVPNIHPDGVSVMRAEHLLKELSVPKKYLTVQPLFDAEYDKHRNQAAGWWQVVIEKLSVRLPTVVLGTPESAAKLKLPFACFPMISRGVDPMTSLALIERATMHVGGATGTTIWATILRVPTVAVYKTWTSTGMTDVRPISFGKPVLFSPLSDSPASTAERIISAYKQQGGEIHADDGANRGGDGKRGVDQRGELAEWPVQGDDQRGSGGQAVLGAAVGVADHAQSGTAPAQLGVSAVQAQAG
jgi:hypothetical protein